jgi:hypothetical protein
MAINFSSYFNFHLFNFNPNFIINFCQLHLLINFIIKFIHYKNLSYHHHHYTNHLQYFILY